MNNTVPPKVYEIINKVLNNDIKNFEISVHAPNKKGEGYLGEILFVSLINKNSGQTLHIVIKQAFDCESTRKVFPIRNMFQNEIHFYSKIWPTFQQFQQEMLSTMVFDKIPKCYATATDEGFEKIVLENIKFENFEIHDKKKPLDKEQIKFILKEYGKFHALSFAYRAIHPEEYVKLSKGLENTYSQFFKAEPFRHAINESQELAMKSLQPGKDDKIIQKYRKYIETGAERWENSINYEGKYSAILHGDCWTNNMMFKYDETGKLTDMKIIDFQLSQDGNPVNDLSYVLYSGGSKEILDELDYYLKVYHNSLSETLTQFNLNSEYLYPFHVLKNDWKKHCYMGFAMGIMMWRTKSKYDETITDLTDVKENFEDMKELFAKTKFDEALFQKESKDLILHMYNNDFF